MVDPKLIDQLVASGVKITPAKVVATGAMADGRVVWLETGDADRGLQHIVERHGSEFAQMGATEADIPQIVINAVTEDIFLGYQGAKKDTPIFVTMVQGQLWKIAVTIGSNGFIVAANSKGRVR